jgi:ABC-type glycerol-3-phosphate transport system permease component
MTTRSWRASPRPAWMEKPRPLTNVAKALALVLVVAMVLVPFLVVVSTSLASSDEVTSAGGWVLLPAHPTLTAYRDLLSGGVVTHALLVSTGITLVGTAVSLVCTVCLAYALSRPRFVAGKPILLLVLFTFLFPPGIIPSYLLVKSLGLLNSYASLFLPMTVNVFNLVVVRGFFQGLPTELYDAARVDGVKEWQMLLRIVVPLSKAVIAVVGLFYAVAYWNSFFTAFLYLDDASKWPLSAVLRLFVTQGAQLGGANASESANYQAPQTVQMAVVVLATLPILCVYPFLQRFFTKGVLTGAVKA